MPTFCYTHEGFVLFLNELRVQLNKPAIKLLAWLMVALLEKTRAHLFRLAEKLPDDATTDKARQQRIRRFLSNRLIFPRLFVPAIVSTIRPLVEADDVLELVIDRTEWMRRGIAVNVLDVGLSYQGRALPLHWTACLCNGRQAENRRGCSSIDAWKQVLAPVIDALRAATWTQGKTIHVNADREFASPKLSQWLWETYLPVPACAEGRQVELGALCVSNAANMSKMMKFPNLSGTISTASNRGNAVFFVDVRSPKIARLS